MTFDHLVGIPWRERGRSDDGLDCWGLFRMLLALRGIDLPSFADGYSGMADQGAIGGLIGAERVAWVPVEPGAERPFDAALFAGSYWHIGGVVGSGFMLHMPRGRTSVIEPYRAAKFERRFDGFYRHPRLA